MQGFDRRHSVGLRRFPSPIVLLFSSTCLLFLLFLRLLLLFFFHDITVVVVPVVVVVVVDVFVGFCCRRLLPCRRLFGLFLLGVVNVDILYYYYIIK